MSKQDRQGVRTPADLERKYSFNKRFAEAMNLADDAQETAEQAEKKVEDLNKELDHDEIFRRLTKDGTLQGLYRGDDGELYINASYIKSGTILADLIKAGVIRSQDDKKRIVIDLNKGYASLAGNFTTRSETDDGDPYYTTMNPEGISIKPSDQSTISCSMQKNSVTIDSKTSLVSLATDRGGLYDNASIWMSNPAGDITLSLDVTNPGPEQVMSNRAGTVKLTTKIKGLRAYITGLTAPVDASDAANKAYVDQTAICYGEYAISSLNETDAVMTAIVNSIGGYGKRFIMFNYNGQLFGCTVYRGSERYSWAEADSYTSDNAYKMHRVMLAGVWKPWEWENPPMKVDEEYRTTERWNGKPVYQKLVSLGALPNASIRRYENVASFAHIVDLRLVIKTKDEIDAADRLAAFSGMSVYGSSTASIWAEAQSNLAVNTYSWDASNYIGFAMMKYVK